MGAFLDNGEIWLRSVEPEDAEIMWKVENDSDQWIQNGMSAPFSHKNIMDYALTYNADPFQAGQIRLIASLKRDNTFMGIADLYEISAIHRHAFVGIYILPEFRSKGFGSQVLRLIEDYAFRLLNLRNLGARIMSGNEFSIKMFSHKDYILRGTVPGWLIYDDKEYEMLFYSKCKIR